ncbi:putative multicopper oxidases [Moorella thermoacetica Y72]|uniref:Putative multicopper oxidases n=1 Tax=Moorella thermoacetica Y72 TaxID=1325331 RepID=A0A0S6UAV3_NEOTH|nr:putative multicopper oxidases [Moorella thermoacetica Y72]
MGLAAPVSRSCLTRLPGLIPDAIGDGSPIPGVGSQFGRELLRCLVSVELGRAGARLGHHLPQHLRVVDKGAGPAQVGIKRLAFLVGPEKGVLQGLHQADMVNITGTVVDKGAGLYFPGGVDVEVAPAAGDTAVARLAVVPEVHQEDGFRLAEILDAVEHPGPLLRRGHHLQVHVLTDGDIGEIPAKGHALFHQHIYKFLAAQFLGIVTAVGDRDPVYGPGLAHEIHGLHHPGENAFTPAGVGLFLKTFQAQGYGNITQANHVVYKGPVNQGTVGKEMEDLVGMFLCQANNILPPHHGFPAGEDDKVDPQLLPLSNYPVHGGEIQFPGPLVVAGPAAPAVEVTFLRRVHENGPGHCHSQFRRPFLLPRYANKGRINKKIHGQALANIGMGCGQQPSGKLVPVAFFIFQYFLNVGYHLPVVGVPRQFFGQGDQARDIFFGIIENQFYPLLQYLFTDIGCRQVQSQNLLTLKFIKTQKVALTFSTLTTTSRNTQKTNFYFNYMLLSIFGQGLP